MFQAFVYTTAISELTHLRTKQARIDDRRAKPALNAELPLQRIRFLQMSESEFCAQIRNIKDLDDSSNLSPDNLIFSVAPMRGLLARGGMYLVGKPKR
jgi:hypothetical protein